MNDAGPLDNMVLLRYAHVAKARTSGGVEQYLGRLNRELLIRNRMTIVQMHLQEDAEFDGRDLREDIGRGTLLWAPVRIIRTSRSVKGLTARLRRLAATLPRTTGVDGSRRTPLTQLARLLWTSCATHLRYPDMVQSERLIGVLHQSRVTLMAFHWVSYDVWGLLAEASAQRIPFVFVNHFDNARLTLPDVRRFIATAAAVGGVSNLGVPEFVRKGYFNLSDAVDTEFFSPAATRTGRDDGDPLVLLPARVDHQKGHADVLRAAAILASRQCDTRLAFAGVIQSRHLEQELRAQASSAGLGDRVAFLGQQTAEQMRDLYAASSVVVLPSYSEGLGRVLLEAQAMERPVVAYNTGGVPDAVLQRKSGYLVSVGNVEALADALHALLADPANAVRMGQTGRDFVTRNFGVAALVARHEAFYRAAVSPQEMISVR